MRKRLLAISLTLVLALALTGCGGSSSSTSSADEDVPEEETLPEEIQTLREDIAIDVLGAFHIDPSATAGAVFGYVIDDGLDYVVVVYDITNNGAKNYDISDLRAKIMMDNGNSYSQVGFLNSYGENLSTNDLKTFIDYCGYSSPISDDPDTLMGKGGYRMIALWEVNGNDLLDGGALTFTLTCDDMVDYGDDSSSGFNVTVSFGSDGTSQEEQHELQFAQEIDMSQIETITYPDEIFQVEDNYEAYQIQHSIAARASMAQTQFKLLSDNGWVATELGIVKALFDEGEALNFSDTSDGTGVGIAGYIFSTELPLFHIESLREVDSAIAGIVELLRESTSYVDTALGEPRSDIDITETNRQIELINGYLATLASYNP